VTDNSELTRLVRRRANSLLARLTFKLQRIDQPED
jgi:hypothetical protein